METLYVFYIITGVLAVTVSFFILISRKRSSMIKVKLATDVLWSANFFFRGSIALTGCVQNAIAIIREIVFYYRGKKKWASSPVWLILFILFFATMPIYTWVGWLSLLPAVVSILSTIGFYFKKPHNTRIINLFVQSLMLLYASLVSNVFSIVSSSVKLLSVFIGLFMDYRDKKKQVIKTDFIKEA